MARGNDERILSERNKIKLITNIFIMKTKLLLLFLMSPIVFNAQDTHLDSVLNKIDKIFIKENQFLKSNGHYSYYFGKKNNLPTNNEKIVLKYIEKKIYKDSLPNRIRVATELIYSLCQESKDLKVRQRGVNDLLYYYNIPLSIKGQRIEDFKNEDFNKKAKKRIKQLLLGESSKYEQKIKAEYDFRDTRKRYFAGTERQARRLSKNDSSSYQKKLDSLLLEDKNRYIKQSKEWTHPVETERLLYIIGWFYWYDFIPLLEDLLLDKRYKKYYFNIKLVLTRMEVEKYEQEILNRLNLNGLYYVSTKNAVLKYSEQLDNFKDIYAYRGWSDESCPISYTAYQNLQYWIINFPDSLKTEKENVFDYGKDELEKMKKTKIWIHENINIIIIDKYYIK